MNNKINDWDKMISRKLYNPASFDVEKRHNRGMKLCDKFNRIPYGRKRKNNKHLKS